MRGDLRQERPDREGAKCGNGFAAQALSWGRFGEGSPRLGEIWRGSSSMMVPRSVTEDETGQVHGCPGRVCYDRNPYSWFCGCLPIIQDQTKRESSPRCSINVGSCVVDDSVLRTMIVRQKNCLALATCSDYERGARRLPQTSVWKPQAGSYVVARAQVPGGDK